MAPRELLIETPRAYLPLLRPARYKGARGGRGSAKSHFFAELLIETTLMQHTRALCIREHQASLRNSVKPLVEAKIEKFGVGHKFSIKESYIAGPHDSLFIFQGMKNHTADSIKSFEGFNIAWIEEAQRFSQRSLNLLRPTIRERGSEIWSCWNTTYKTDPIDKFFMDGVRDQPEDFAFVHTTYRDNPWFPEVLMKEVEYDRKRDLEGYLHIWEGQYDTKSSKRVFKRWGVSTDPKFIADPFSVSGTEVYGADWGFSISPTVFLRIVIRDKKLYITHEAYKIGCEIDATPALFDQIPGARGKVIVADSARPESISYMRRHGYPRIEPSRKGPNSVEEGVRFLQGYDIEVHPDCVHAIHELTNYSYKVDKLTEEVLPELDDTDNHYIDAARYAVERVRRPKGGMLG